VSVHCTIDDFPWPWDEQTPVLMMHGFARDALFWNRWVPAIAKTAGFTALTYWAAACRTNHPPSIATRPRRSA